MGHGSAVEVLPAALTVAYAVLGLHGLLLLAGLDVILWGPSLTPEQCFGVVVLYLLGRLFRPSVAG
ncbi:hypothetical protein DMH04_28675 [Kibdelosporangium aridum]|uniref:Uncharacterized protein n=1 Tax=Kibdelosporangium aridum TaxID=2030 RepID=A0A428Z3V8_KIBAR|nr:hypothetical protein DMH04_28675 [Kibdelosporangium aridum]